VPRVPLLLVAGWSALALAWVFSNPPFAAPDEGQHYLRVQGVEQGQLVGPKADPATFAFPTAEQREWTAEAAREVEVPARLIPLDVGCYVFVRDISAACLDDLDEPADPVVAVTLVGNYQPLPYLLPAVAAKAADSSVEALRLGRLAGALLALSLLALAVAAAWDARAPGLSLLGPALAVTPMVIFCSAILNGSSLEITAGIAFIACLFRLARDASPSPWVWAGAGISGATFALSRSAAPLWIVLTVLVVVAVYGPGAMWRKLRAGARPAIAAVAAIAVAIGANLIWERAYGPDVPVDLTQARLAFRTGLDQLPRWLEEMVGRFGYLEFSLPLPVYIFWGFATLAGVACALRWAPIRGKVVLAVCVLALAALPLTQYILVQRHTGFGLQGRHVLPILVIVPLLAGELLRSNHERFAAARVRHLIALPFVGIALVQFTALYWNGRRSAVGVDGPLFFLGSAEWSPPLGWGVWLAVAAGGSACLAAAGLLAARAEASHQRRFRPGAAARRSAPGPL
jgi:predicted membrane protein DUF2142